MDGPEPEGQGGIKKPETGQSGSAGRAESRRIKVVADGHCTDGQRRDLPKPRAVFTCQSRPIQPNQTIARAGGYPFQRITRPESFGPDGRAGGVDSLGNPTQSRPIKGPCGQQSRARPTKVTVNHPLPGRDRSLTGPRTLGQANFGIAAQRSRVTASATHPRQAVRRGCQLSLAPRSRQPEIHLPGIGWQRHRLGDLACRVPRWNRGLRSPIAAA